MSTVELRGLMQAHDKNRRAQRELAHHQEREMNRTPVWLSEDKAGKCYTYRGVKYCYS